MSTPASSGDLAAAAGDPRHLLHRLKESIAAFSSDSETVDSAGESVAAVISILDLIADAPDSDVGIAEEALAEVHRYLSDSPDQVVVDSLSMVLPLVLVKIAGLSGSVSDMAGMIIDCLVSVCSPQEMLSILGEALDTQINVSKDPITYIPFLNGLSKVFLGIRRQADKQVKVALPIIVRVLNEVSLEFSDENNNSLLDIFGAAISVGIAIKTISEKLVERSREELSAILGLYALQIIALITRCRHTQIVSSCGSLVVKVSLFLPFCGLSFLDLLTGDAVAAITSKITEEDGEHFVSNFSLVNDGACLAVTWGYVSDEVAKAAEEQVSTLLDYIRNDRSKRLQAAGTLRSSLSSIHYPWEIKSHIIELILTMMDGRQSEDPSDSLHIDVSSFIPSLFVTLQAIQRVMIGASDASLRKKAFAALKKIISDLPYSERFDMLMALITHSISPSMVAILFDLVREEILIEYRQRNLLSKNETMRLQIRTTISAFWSSHVRDLVEMVLHPSQGGPPSLPENIETVLAALNLYRFVLILESKGKSNYTGLLSEEMLQKAYSEWFFPLRTLVSGIRAEADKDGSEVAVAIDSALNPVELVLYRCIELVEDSLKHCK